MFDLKINHNADLSNSIKSFLVTFCFRSSRTKLTQQVEYLPVEHSSLSFTKTIHRSVEAEVKLIPNVWKNFFLNLRFLVGPIFKKVTNITLRNFHEKIMQTKNGRSFAHLLSLFFERIWINFDFGLGLAS